jgi:maltooligosyltrehalose trehalohydrolase
MMLGAVYEGGATRFHVWAPRARTVEVELGPGRTRTPMTRGEGGYWEARASGVGPGTRYYYVLDGERRRPDPASRAQPEGVHGPSEVVDPAAFVWHHATVARALEDYVLYELHVGTFTPEGTFDAAAHELDRLVDLGITAVEIMPVAAFPGTRNWGYDGAHWFAVQASYGGPDGLRRFVDACHARGLHVVLDVVYNHLGPEGNYLAEFGPYFTDRHVTPWGPALDYDGEHAAPVRAHVLANARMWVDEYRVDALRLDAVHAIFDDSPRHIVGELCDELRALAHRLGRSVHLIAESDLGDVRVIETPAERVQAWGCDAQWSDDLHHALHAALTGERSGYFADFGSLTQLARAITDGFVFTGQPSRYRKKPFGTPSKHLPGERFVVCAQNHDQIGNRARGERLAHLEPGSELAIAAVLLTAPAVPLLFMGEEYSDPAPFLYFTDHGDPQLKRAVSEGRRREFGWANVDVPDPQAPGTFHRSRIDLDLGSVGRHAGVRRFHQALLALRKSQQSLRALDKKRSDAVGDDAAGTLLVRRWSDEDETLVAVSLVKRPTQVIAPAPRYRRWRVVLDAGEARFGGPPGAEVRDVDGALEIKLPPYGVIVCSDR